VDPAGLHWNAKLLLEAIGRAACRLARTPRTRNGHAAALYFAAYRDACIDQFARQHSAALGLTFPKNTIN
jgi:hypothetical protein